MVKGVKVTAQVRRRRVVKGIVRVRHAKANVRPKAAAPVPKVTGAPKAAPVRAMGKVVVPARKVTAVRKVAQVRVLMANVVPVRASVRDPVTARPSSFAN